MSLEDVEKMYQELEELSYKLGFVNTQKALPFARRVHEGKYRRGNGLPYISHPLFVATYFKNRGIINDEAWATGLLHDTVEDVPDCGFDLQPFSDSIKRRVHLLDFKKGLLEKRQAQLIYMEKILNDDWITNLTKDIDRLHNLLTTKGAFTPSKLEDYLDETIALFYPIFPTQQQKFSDYSMEFYDLENRIKNFVKDLDTNGIFKDENKRVLNFRAS